MKTAVRLPPALRAGDTVGVFSPSWCGPALFPLRFDRGLRQLEALGLRVRVAAHARSREGWVSDTAQNRVRGLHELFADDEVRALVASIGGEHANQMLPLLDFDLIASRPKILLGFSDITVLSLAIWTKTAWSPSAAAR